MKPTPKSSFRRIKDQKPSFFKVLIMDHSSTRLRIPPAFIRKYNGFVPKKLVTLVSKHRSCQVHLKKIDGDYYLERGWDKFFKYHLLEFGDFLVFKYIGTCTFKVKIFDPTCCERQVKKKKKDGTSKNVEKSELEVIYIDYDNEKDKGKGIVKEEVEIIYIDCAKDKDSEKFMVKEADEIIYTGSINGYESHKISRAAAQRKAGNFKSNHPFFSVVLRPIYVRRIGAYLAIPTDFFKKHMRSEEQYVVLETSGMAWTVQVGISYNGHRAYGRLYSGWVKFVRANRLNAGDTCVFEMVMKGKNVVFEVHIFRL